ncbi:MFS transporter [Streptomyces sp. NPDC048629]|uniref:MFS transporter n=1 Tax=Streptomyces sp. NPDC048629 TaxID=3154824 RepID=UPI00341F98BE
MPSLTPLFRSANPLPPGPARHVVRLNNGFQLSFNLLWWMPVFYEYQRQSGLSDPQIFGIQSIYYVAFCLLEVPTGLLADRIGLRRCLRLGAVVMAVANVLPALRPDYAGFLAHFLALALARSLVSGAGSAYLYEYLDRHRASAGYAQAEGTARALGLLGKIACWPFVGILMQLDRAAPYWLSALGAAVALGFAVALPRLPAASTAPGARPDARPDARLGAKASAGGPLAAVRGAAAVLRGTPRLVPLMIQGVAVFTLARILQVNLFQPLLLDKDVPVADHGTLLSAMTLAEAVAASRPGWLRRRLGDSTAVGVLSLVMAGTLAATVLAGSAGTAVLLCVFAAAGGLAYPVQRHLINSAIPATPYRATLLSLESIVDRAVCALAALAVGGYLAAGRLPELLVHSAVGSCLLLAGASLFLRRRQGAADDAESPGGTPPPEGPPEVSAGGQTEASSRPSA